MKNWIEIPREERMKIWDRIYPEFDFSPNKKIIVNKLPEPNRVINFTDYFTDKTDHDKVDKDLEEKLVKCFLNISSGERMIALDWQHLCYTFDPALPFERDEFNEWLVPALPNGDYYLFFTKDFKNGIFGDGLEKLFYYYGDELVNELEKNRPLLFDVNES